MFSITNKLLGIFNSNNRIIRWTKGLSLIGSQAIGYFVLNSLFKNAVAESTVKDKNHPLMLRNEKNFNDTYVACIPGDEFQVNAYPTNNKGKPLAAGLEDGGFVITWTCEGEDGSGSDYGVCAQIYNVDGSSVNSEFNIATYTPWYPSDCTLHHSVAGLKDDRFVVTWGDFDGSMNVDIYGQLYNSTGYAIDEMFDVATYMSAQGVGEYISTTSLENGDFVVAWASAQGDYQVRGQRFNSTGNSMGNEFLVPKVGYENWQPTVASLEDGGFVVAWSIEDTPGYDIYGQLYSASASPVGDKFKVNNVTGSNIYPSVTGLEDGGFVVAWESDGTSPDDAARRYNSTGNPVDNGFTIPSVSRQCPPSIASIGDGGFIVREQRYNVTGNLVDSIEGDFTDYANLQDGGFIAVYGSNNIYARRYVCTYESASSGSQVSSSSGFLSSQSKFSSSTGVSSSESQVVSSSSGFSSSQSQLSSSTGVSSSGSQVAGSSSKFSSSQSQRSSSTGVSSSESQAAGSSSKFSSSQSQSGSSSGFSSSQSQLSSSTGVSSSESQLSNSSANSSSESQLQVHSISSSSSVLSQALPEEKDYLWLYIGGGSVLVVLIGANVIGCVIFINQWNKKKQEPLEVEPSHELEIITKVEQQSSIDESSSISTQEDEFEEQAVEISFSLLTSAPIPSLHISYSDLYFKERLGEGGFGTVYKGTWGTGDAEVAIKQLHIKDMTVDTLKEFEGEIKIMSDLRHPNVVQLYGACCEPGRYSLVMEYMSNGSLFDLLHNSQPLSWTLRYRIAMDITNGLSLLHSRNILHRDLKSLNVLLDDRMRAKLSDFGLARVRTETTNTTTMTQGKSVGTIPWMSSELLSIRPKYTKKSDMYSYGMVLWELMTRVIPFSGAEANIIVQHVRGGGSEEISEDQEQKYSGFAVLIKRCWASRAESRPTIEEAAEYLKVNPIEQQNDEDEYTVNAPSAPPITQTVAATVSNLLSSGSKPSAPPMSSRWHSFK